MANINYDSIKKLGYSFREIKNHRISWVKTEYDENCQCNFTRVLEYTFYGDSKEWGVVYEGIDGYLDNDFLTNEEILAVADFIKEN